MWGNGSYKRRNLEAGVPVAKEVNPVMQFCFAMETRELEKVILGKKDDLMESKKGRKG